MSYGPTAAKDTATCATSARPARMEARDPFPRRSAGVGSRESGFLGPASLANALARLGTAEGC